MLMESLHFWPCIVHDWLATWRQDEDVPVSRQPASMGGVLDAAGRLGAVYHAASVVREGCRGLHPAAPAFCPPRHLAATDGCPIRGRALSDLGSARAGPD